jgi:hypothetical protein
LLIADKGLDNQFGGWRRWHISGRKTCWAIGNTVFAAFVGLDLAIVKREQKRWNVFDDNDL